MSDKVTSEVVFDRKALYRRLAEVRADSSSSEHLTNDEIFDYAFERLSTDETDRIDAHLYSGCKVCLNDMEMVLDIFNPWIGEIAATPELLVSLGSRLADRTWNTRVSAAAMVAALGPVAATAGILRGLLKLLEDGSELMRQSAVAAFRGLGVAGRSPEVSKALDAMLRDPNFKVRSAATVVVRYFNEATADDARSGNAPASKVDDEHHDKPRRGVLCYRATAEHLDELASFLSSAEDMERAAAVQVVAALGSAAAEPNFIRTLLGLLQDENDETRFAAMEAIEAVGPAAAWPDFVSGCRDLLRSDRSVVREAAAQIIRSLGPAASREPTLSTQARSRFDTGARSNPRLTGGMIHEPMRFAAKGKVDSAKPAQELPIPGTILVNGRSIARAQLYLKRGGEVLLVLEREALSAQLSLEMTKARIGNAGYPLELESRSLIVSVFTNFRAPIVWVVKGLKWKKAKSAFEADAQGGKGDVEIHVGVDGGR